jgi:hypothetical protein
MAVVLRIWDELPDDEIVACFGEKGVQLSERTVRRHIASGFEMIRRQLIAAENPGLENQK